MSAYYNENDLFAAEWLRNLVAAGHIAPGEVDTRSIEDVTADDLRGFTQCHFFAGIGVWSHALRSAGWTDDRMVWTGSCPCQPFSAAGKRGGTADERHLWPAFFHLIEQCRPPVVLGEQVASKDGLAWLDLVQADMEGAGYAFGANDLCAAGFGAPHIRQRLYFVGLANTAHQQQHRSRNTGEGRRTEYPDDGTVGSMADALPAGRPEGRAGTGDGQATSSSSSIERLADSDDTRLEGRRQSGRERAAECAAGPGELAGGMADTDGRNTGAEGLQRSGKQRQQQEDGSLGGMADSLRGGAEHGPGESLGEEAAVDCSDWDIPGQRLRSGVEGADAGGMGDTNSKRKRKIGRISAEPRAIIQGNVLSEGDYRPSPLNGFWRDADWLLCRDGKWRPVGPGTFPLVNGASARVGRLRAYGNALNAEVAIGFVEAVMDALGRP